MQDQRVLHQVYVDGSGSVTFGTSRLDIDADQTLAAFDTNYANGKFFKTPADLCNMYLVPKGYTTSRFPAAWYGSDITLVGDNERERLYADIYPWVTARPNIFTVYFTVRAVTTSSATPNLACRVSDQRRGRRARERKQGP